MIKRAPGAAAYTATVDSTVVVAAMGLSATVAASGLTAFVQGKQQDRGRVLDAKLLVYGDCSETLYEYERATYNRVKARILHVSGPERDRVRQEAYHCNAKARSAIGRVSILTRNEPLRSQLEHARHAIGDYNKCLNDRQLRDEQKALLDHLQVALDQAREDLS